MQKVRLIHSVYQSHKNGANTVISLLLKSSGQFLKNGIELNSMFPSERYRGNQASKGVNNIIRKCRKGAITKIKKVLTRLAGKSTMAARLMIYIDGQHSGKAIINKYLSIQDSDDETLFFHTFFTCYYYLKHRKAKQHVVLVMHTNGESFKMERIYYPALEKSVFYKKMLEMEKYVYTNVDRISFVSSASRQSFIANHPYVNPDKVFFVYNGVDYLPVIDHKKNDDVIEICCVASITTRKGQHYILEALRKTDNLKDYKIHFTFVGDGDQRPYLEKYAADNGLNDYISFVGVTNQVDKYLVNSDIYILPSEDEGLPMAILEAMRASLPIVSTPVGGIPEIIIDGYNGYLIHPSVEGVLSFLDRLNNTDWISFGRNSRKIFEEKFTVEKMIDGYSALLQFD